MTRVWSQVLSWIQRKHPWRSLHPDRVTGVSLRTVSSQGGHYALCEAGVPGPGRKQKLGQPGWTWGKGNSRGGEDSDLAVGHIQPHALSTIASSVLGPGKSPTSHVILV